MKIQIHLTSRVSDGTDTQSTVQTLHGFLRQNDNSFEISYREPEGDDGLSNTLTTLRLFSSHAELSRRGDYTCLLTMEPGNRRECVYETPFGSLTLVTDTTAYAPSISPDGSGTLHIAYSLTVAGETTTHELQLTIRKCTQ